jgi:hypothetical protein
MAEKSFDPHVIDCNIGIGVNFVFNFVGNLRLYEN